MARREDGESNHVPLGRDNSRLGNHHVDTANFLLFPVLVAVDFVSVFLQILYSTLATQDSHQK